MKKTIGFWLFRLNNSNKEAASSRIRGDWVIRYWKRKDTEYYPEVFRSGKRYDAIIFEKSYPIRYAQAYKGIKILDICDPDFLQLESLFMEFAENVDAITCSSQGLYNQVKQMLPDKIVEIVPDCHAPEYYNQFKEHDGKLKEVVWYGYAHNAKVLDIVAPILNRHKIRLSVISNEPIITGCKDERYTKWKLGTFCKEAVKSDAFLSIGSTHPHQKYKSNNRIITAQMLGLPVIKNEEDIATYQNAQKRNTEALRAKQEALANYCPCVAVEKYLDVIKKVKERRAM